MWRAAPSSFAFCARPPGKGEAMLSAITKIEETSPLRHKVRRGDRLASINGNPIHDVLDYKYFAYDPDLRLEFVTAEGKLRLVRVKKPRGADLGLEFETYLMDKARACSNRCLFCFVDQLPRGLRRTLYFKDDDARLSFLTGNYITLTNLSEREIQRICDLKISPINVSVHATDPKLRAYLLGNPAGERGMEIIRCFARAGITMNCQIVCCPGINDGAALQQSMEDLAPLFPQVYSVSIVPVGLTKHRAHLPQLTPFDRAGAAAVLDLVEAFGEQCRARYGSRIFFCSDELYLKAERSLPPYAFYEDFSQLENGVGLLRSLETEFLQALEAAEGDSRRGSFTAATGTAAQPFIHRLFMQIREKYANISGNAVAIENDFFGHTIDVAGLITGQDLIAQLRGKALGDRLLIPQNMLRHGEGVFLDDVTLEQVERELGVPVRVVPQDGGELFKAVLGE